MFLFYTFKVRKEKYFIYELFLMKLFELNVNNFKLNSHNLSLRVIGFAKLNR